MSGARIHANEEQKQIEPARQPEREPIHQQVPGPVQAAPRQAAYRTQISRNGLVAADLLALQRAVGNLRTQQVIKIISRQKPRSALTGHALVGAAAQTPVKSVGEYSDLIIKLLTEDQGRKLSIQEVVRRAAEAKSIGLAAPTTAEAGKARPLGKARRNTALILTNAQYQKPSENLPKTDSDGANMFTQLQTRRYKTTWLKNQTAAGMVSALKDALTGAQAGDNVVIFYSGHGEVEGMQGTDNRFVSPQIVAGWKDHALATGYELTVIIDACHAGSTTDFIRKEESVRIREAGKVGGEGRAVALATIAEQLQQIKDELAKLERAKQALLEEPLAGRLQKAGTLEKEIERKAKGISAAWKNALPKITGLAKQVKGATGEQLAVPAFGPKREWLNTEQLDQLDTMTNRTLELARQALGR